MDLVPIIIQNKDKSQIDEGFYGNQHLSLIDTLLFTALNIASGIGNVSKTCFSTQLVEFMIEMPDSNTNVIIRYDLNQTEETKYNSPIKILPEVVLDIKDETDTYEYQTETISENQHCGNENEVRFVPCMNYAVVNYDGETLTSSNEGLIVNEPLENQTSEVDFTNLPQPRINFHPPEYRTTHDTYYCGMCSGYFSSLLDINEHEKSDCGKRHERVYSRETPYSCSVCGKSYLYLSSKNKHETIHLGESAHSCTVCGKAFLRFKDKIRHERIHTEEKPYSCRICGKAFSDSSQKSVHERIHTGEKPYACQVCGKSFAIQSNKIAHEKIHTGEKPYACSICGRSFLRAIDKLRHERIHTGERPYSCGVCGKTFPSSSSKSKHEKIHSGERPFSCTMCGKSFLRAKDKTRHERIHTGEKPYSCTVCGKCFSNSSEKTVHQRIHTGEKPFSCRICGKCFSNPANKIRHEKAHAVKKE